jgi:hypothetical protein
MDVNELEEYILQQQADEYNHYMEWMAHAQRLVYEDDWTFVQLNYDINTDFLHKWMEKYVKGRWDANWDSMEFVFENGKDATWVRLYWETE